jgi:hypothetical protein
MTMEETARLALFNIKLIQDTKIDASVGYSTECLPQVYFVPDVKFPAQFRVSTPITEEQQMVVDEYFSKQPIRELTDKDVTCLIDAISKKVLDLVSEFKQGHFRDYFARARTKKIRKLP